MKLTHLRDAELHEYRILLCHDYRNEPIDCSTPTVGQFQLHLAPITITAHSFQKTSFGQLVYHPGQCTAVVPILVTDIPRVHDDAIAYPQKNQILLERN